MIPKKKKKEREKKMEGKNEKLMEWIKNRTEILSYNAKNDCIPTF